MVTSPCRVEERCINEMAYNGGLVCSLSIGAISNDLHDVHRFFVDYSIRIRVIDSMLSTFPSVLA